MVEKVMSELKYSKSKAVRFVKFTMRESNELECDTFHRNLEMMRQQKMMDLLNRMAK